MSSRDRPEGWPAVVRASQFCPSVSLPPARAPHSRGGRFHEFFLVPGTVPSTWRELSHRTSPQAFVAVLSLPLYKGGA